MAKRFKPLHKNLPLVTSYTEAMHIKKLIRLILHLDIIALPALK